MLMNNLDPAVAERPEELIVYGGGGKAARNWECYERIVATLRRLENDETLLVQSGKPVGVFRTHEEAPRVLIANAHLVPRWATWDEFRRLDALGLTMYGQMTAGSWIYIGTQGILQGTYETFAECARQHFGGTLAGRLVVTGGLGGMGGAQPLAATMNGAAFLGVDVDEARIRRRVETGYCDRLEHDLDAALRAGRGRTRAPAAPLSVGLVGQHRRGAAGAGPARASCPTCSPTRPRRTTCGVGYIPAGLSLDAAAGCASAIRPAYEARVLDSMVVHVRAMLALKAKGAVDLRLRQQPAGPGGRPPRHARGLRHSRASCPRSSGRSSAAAPARSAGPRSRATRPTSPSTDQAVLETFPEKEALARWIRQAQERVQFQGLPARICWLEYGERAEMGLRFNWLVKHGKVRAPIVIGRDHLDTGSVASPNRETEGDEGRLGRHRRLAAAQRAAQHRLRRELGLAAPRRRRGHRLLDPRRHGGRGRRHRRRPTAGSSGCSPPIPAPASCATRTRGTSSRSRRRGSGGWICRWSTAELVRSRATRRRLGDDRSMTGMNLLENIGQLATCRAEGGQGEIHAIADAALVWEGDAIRWVGPRGGAAGGVPRRRAARCRRRAGDPGPGRLPHASRLRRLARRGVRAAAPGPELPRDRRGRRRDRAHDAAHPRRERRRAGRARDGLPRARCCALGVTTVECKSGYGLDRAQRAPAAPGLSRASRRAQPVRLVPTFLGAHVVPPEFRDDRAGYLALLIDDLLPTIARERLARVLRRVRRALGVHRGGGAPAARGGAGGGPRRQAARRPAQRRRRRRARGGGGRRRRRITSSAPRTPGIAAMARAGVVAVSLPLASLYLGQPPAPARRWIEAGVAGRGGDRLQPRLGAELPSAVRADARLHAPADDARGGAQGRHHHRRARGRARGADRLARAGQGGRLRGHRRARTSITGCTTSGRTPAGPPSWAAPVAWTRRRDSACRR